MTPIADHLSPEAPPRRRVGPWALDRRVGVGGTAEVWRAHAVLDPSDVVALKVFGRAARDAWGPRLGREADLLAELDHPRIVRLRDADFSAEEPWLALEWLGGATLGEELSAEALPFVRAWRLFGHLVDAMAYLHVRDIQHRDVKPANLVLDASGGTLKLIDFGLARDGLVPASPHDSSFGTLPYVPPEWGASYPDPARWDVWSMGVVLWEMLHGRRAFPSPEGRSRDDVLDWQRHKAASLPLDPGPIAPSPVRALVRAMTSAAPDGRPADAMVVLRHYRAISAGTPLPIEEVAVDATTIRLPPPHPSWSWWGVRRWIAKAVG